MHLQDRRTSSPLAHGPHFPRAGAIPSGLTSRSMGRAYRAPAPSAGNGCRTASRRGFRTITTVRPSARRPVLETRRSPTSRTRRLADPLSPHSVHSRRPGKYQRIARDDRGRWQDCISLPDDPDWRRRVSSPIAGHLSTRARQYARRPQPASPAHCSRGPDGPSLTVNSPVARPRNRPCARTTPSNARPAPTGQRARAGGSTPIGRRASAETRFSKGPE